MISIKLIYTWCIWHFCFFFICWYCIKVCIFNYVIVCFYLLKTFCFVLFFWICAWLSFSEKPLKCYLIFIICLNFFSLWWTYFNFIKKSNFFLCFSWYLLFLNTLTHFCLWLLSIITIRFDSNFNPWSRILFNKDYP